MTLIVDYPFTESESEHAHNVWGANCGPNALAFALGIHIDKVRGKIPDFEKKQYTNPSMMRAALVNLNATWGEANPKDTMFLEDAVSLVRVQWTGPWTAPGANAKWAYRYTHWIATWRGGVLNQVFDCNGGVRHLESWVSEIVPLLTDAIPRADGGSKPTHLIRVKR